MIDSYHSIMLRTLLGPLVVALQLFGFYVLVHGHYSPGGGFQAGTLLACSLMLPMMVYGSGTHYLSISEGGAMIMGAVGVLIFLGVGIVPMFFDGEMLNYAQLPLAWLGVSEAMRRSYGILLIEVGVTLAVAGAVVSMFYTLNVELPEGSLHE